MSKPRRSDASRLAKHIVQSQRLPGPLAERLRRRVLAVGRAMHCGVHLVRETVYAELVEHGTHAMSRGTVHVTVWVDAEPEDLVDEFHEVIAAHKPAGILVTFEVRRASWWHRVLAWWRVRRSE